MTTMRFRLRSVIGALAATGALVLGLLLLGGDRFPGLEADALPAADLWQQLHRGLQGWHAQQPVLAASVFLVVVVLARMLPVPTGFILAFAGGLLFGPVLAASLIAFGAGVSAVAVAVLGRWLFRSAIERRLGSYLRSLESDLQRDGFRCLLAARLIPVLPATVVNLLPVVLPIPLRQVFLATLFGLLPMAYLTARLGSDAGALDAAEGLALSSDALWSLSLFALLVLLPAPVRWWRARRLRRRGDHH